MVVFRNPGEMDIRAVKVMGINAKLESKSAIGYFGTGLKYALAVLLRTGHTVDLTIGTSQYKFSTAPMTLRGKEFELIMMNGEELGFTTELGKKWEVWQAYRELLSNALDEGGDAYDDYWPATSGMTVISVSGPHIDEIHARRWEYFLNPERKPIMSDGVTEAYTKVKGKNTQWFFKGVKIGETLADGMYDYNFTTGIEITEDRGVKYGYQPKWAIQALFQGVQDPKYKHIIKGVLRANAGTVEGILDYDGMCRDYTQHSELWLDIVGDMREEQKDCDMNYTAVQVHMKKRQRNILPEESADMTDVQNMQLERAMTFCRDTLKLKIDKYPLIIAEDLGRGGLGRADIDEKKMYVSLSAFERGTKGVAAALLEEYTHVHHKVLDETPEQKWVYLQQILSLGEELQGEPL